MDVLICEVGEHRLAVRFPDVREVLRAVAITHLPGAPPAVDGLVDVRGEIMPVLNARARFGVSAQALTPDEHFVAVTAATRTMLLRVDRVVDIAVLEDASIRALDDVVAGPRYVSGIAAIPGGLALLHDPRAFLSEAESAELEVALNARTGSV